MNKKDIKILVTDDSAFMRQYIIDNLNEAGYDNIYEAHNGKMAIEVFNDKHPDIVLLDLVMSVMGGIEVLERLVSENANVIIVSAVGQKPMIDRAMAKGAKSYIVKPFFNAQDFDNNIKEIINAK